MLLIVLTAIITRVLFLWVGRPEFVGWFNHTYYYYVQVEALLKTGDLAFSDMPLLFYVYAISAKLLLSLGLEVQTAVIVSTRFWMSIIPSLIPIPVFYTLKSIDKKSHLGTLFWAIVFASAFLPLSILYMPEFLQKNTLGLLLLATLMMLSKSVFASVEKTALFFSGLLFLLIVLTHYGSTGVVLLYLFSVLLAHLITQKNVNFLKYIVVMILGVFLAFSFIYKFDYHRFERIFFYANQALESSFLGILIDAKSNLNQRLFSGLGILIPLIISAFFYKLYKGNQTSLSKADKLFWLSNIILTYLLLLPIYDQLLLGRFTLYLSLPLLFIVTYILMYSIDNLRLKQGIIGFFLIGILLMSFGEFMSLQFHNRNKEEVYADLMDMKSKIAFHENDLILTKNGAEHICNWFLGTKAGVITALKHSDFKKYNRIYILNPIEGVLNYEGIENKDATNEADKYTFMMRNIPQPKEAKVIYESNYIQLLSLENVPQDWVFDENGYWISYGN